MRLKVTRVATGDVIGYMTDEEGEPKGSTAALDELLSGGARTSRAERFAHYAQGLGNNGHVAYDRVTAETKDVHSQVAVHTVGYGIGTVVASQANTSTAKKRKKRRIRALAYRRHPGQGAS